MHKFKDISESQKKDKYTDEEIDELGEFFKELTLKQAFFLKESYEAMLVMQAHEMGNVNVH